MGHILIYTVALFFQIFTMLEVIPIVALNEKVWRYGVWYGSFILEFLFAMAMNEVSSFAELAANEPSATAEEVSKAQGIRDLAK